MIPPMNLFTSTKVAFIAKVSFVLFFLSLSFFSCQGNKTPLADKQGDAEKGYSVFTENANLLVSDSGRTQYHLQAKAWYIYDKGEDARWYFPKGFYGEKVDSLKHAKATLVADTAYYYTTRGQWIFKGNVKVENLSGDTFIAKVLQWDKETRMISSEDSVTVIASDRKLSGTSFRASQDFSKYMFLNNSGEATLPKEEEEIATDTIAE